MAKPLNQNDFTPELIEEINSTLEDGKEVVIKKEKDNVVMLKQQRKIIVKKPI